VPGIPFALVMTPDGKTAFVLNEKSQLMAFAAGTGRIGQPIAIPPAPASSGLAATPVITRDGRTIIGSKRVTVAGRETVRYGCQLRCSAPGCFGWFGRRRLRA
jgi:hypothetical protein